MEIDEGNTVRGIIQEVRMGKDLATVRIQLGESIIEEVIPKALADDMDIKAGDPVTAMFESTPVKIIK